MRRFNKEKFKRLLDTSVFGQNLIYFPAIASTNDHAFNMLGGIDGSELENLNGTLVLADEQTGGRGRFNRQWLSPPGGLWFSLIFRTGLRADKIPSITLIAAFCAADVLIKHYNINVNIKWPNDLYCKDYKFGGILSESKKIGPSHMIILGMGLNIAIDKKSIDKIDKKAVNLQDISKKVIEPELLLVRILKNFEEQYNHFSKSGEIGSIFKKIEKILRYD
ncbi:MAG: biotin--[acetyl-CoA-carboxylase] ligase [Actinomycetia bacterium]|nr:biotin--[acetyl-CoA-carboxylase] ligase [Actinomycetes bacterium]